ISLRHNQLLWPLNLLLILNIQLGNSNSLCCIDLVLRQEFRWSEFKNIQASSNLRRVDVSVVPVSRPVATKYQHLRIDRTTIEVSNLNWLSSISEVHDRDATLIPRLNFNVPAWDRNE